MKADHKYYKSHSHYKDLPGKHKGRIVMMKLVGLLMALPGSSKKTSMMTQGMLAPYRKIIQKAEKN